MAKNYLSDDEVFGTKRYLSEDEVFGAPASPPAEPAPKEEPGLIDRAVGFAREVGNAVLGRDPNPVVREGRSVMEGYRATPQEMQADVDRRLSYGAGPISSQTAAQADMVRSGMAETKSPIVKKVAKAMDEQGVTSFGDLVQRAKNTPEALADQVEQERRKQLAEDNPYLGALGSGSAMALAGAINIPTVAADFVNQSAVNPVLKAFGLPELKRVPQMIGTEYLTKTASDYMPSIGNKEMEASWDRGEFGKWLGVKLAANAMPMAQSLAAAFAPPLRAALLPSMGATAAGQSYVQGDDSRVAVAKGLVEVGTEMLPLGVIDKIGDVLRGMGPTKSSAVLALAGQRLLQAGGVITANSLTGAIEESAAQLGSNALDKYFQGKDVELTKGLAEAAVVGAASGGVMSAPQVAGVAAGTYEPQNIAARELSGLLEGGRFTESGVSADVASQLRTESVSGQIRPEATVVNFTEPDSPTSRAGLTPIVAPVPAATPTDSGEEPTALPPINPQVESEFGLDKLRMGTTNVGTTGGAGRATAGGTVAGSDQPGGGLDAAGLPVAGAGQLGGASASPTAPGAGAPVAAGGAGGQQLASLTQTYNNGEVKLVEPWFGRKGGGYETQGDAQQALPGRERKFPGLDWKIETMPNGKFMLAGYELGQENVSGTQAPQAQQAEAQGQAAAGTLAAPSTAQPAAGAVQAELPAVQTAGVSAGPVTLDKPTRSSLRLAPQAPMQTVAAINAAINKDNDGNPLPANEQVQFAVVSTKDLTDSQRIASAVARMIGKTFTVVREDSGKTLSNGYAQLGGKHLVVAADSNDAPLFVALHEGYHSLPAAQRKSLNAALIKLFRTERKGEFLDRFNYSENQFDEEAPAFMAQVISKRADFWEQLREKMGNKEFASVAKIIIGKLNQILTGASRDYGQDFADKYITDIAKARDLLTDAYAQAMRDAGMQPDVEADAAVMASNKADDIGDKLQARVDSDFDSLVQEYNSLKGTEGGRILDTDIARELSPDYRADRSRSAEVHEAASNFIQKLFEARMAAPHDGEYVAFMAGGGGSGKSSAQPLLGEEFTGAATVLDGTLSSEGKARRNIEMVLDSGRAAVVMYVYREPVEALRNGVLTRAMRGGRTVPIDALVKGHAGASEVVRNLSADYAGNDDVTIRVIDNSRGAGNIAKSDLANITPVIKSGLKERFINAAAEEFQDGRISETVYRATVGDAGAAPEVAREDAQGGQGDRREAGQGREPEGSGDAVVRSNRAKRAGDYTYTTDDKGRIVVQGDIDRIRFLTNKIASGTVLPEDAGVRFKATDADAVTKALKTAPKANPAILAEIRRRLDLTDAEAASTSLEYQTGEAKSRAFESPLMSGIPEVVKFLEDRRRASGLRLLDIAKPEDQDTLAKLMAAETLAAIRSSGNALEWYDETIAKTLAMAAVKYPELGRDKNAQMAFRLAMAITSQGLNVENNLKFTMRQYEAFRTSGKFPEVGEGESGEAMVSNFKLINELLNPDVMGPDMLRRFLVTEFTIGELNQAGFEPGGELVDEKVLGSSVLGPKIGFGFYSNLNGNFEPVTMDMWFMRTIGRLTGNLRSFDAEKFAGQVKRFRDGFDQRGDDGVFADRFDADLVERARTEQDAAIELARQVKKAHEKDYKQNRAAFDAGERKKSQLVFAADTMIQSIDKPKDVPGNGMERRLLREVVRKAVAEVEKAYGQRIPPAAMQALIWYPEQELYKSMGVKLSVTSQDYAGATEKVLTEEGYDAKRLRAAAKSGSARVRQANGRDVGQGSQVDGQEARRVGPLEGTERERFIRTRYEQAQLQLERVTPKRKGVIFEVAPDPNNADLTARWSSLTPAQRLDISGRVARTIIPRVLADLETDGIIASQVGSYLDDTNPSFTLLLEKGDPVEFAKTLGFVLSQDSMMVVSPKPFKGGDEVGAIVVEVGDRTDAEIKKIYDTLRDIEVKGERPIGGQSYANGAMTILNYSDVPTEQLAILVDQKLNKGYTVLTRSVFAAFPQKKDYDYASETNDGRGSRALLRQRARGLRAEASAALEQELDGLRIQRSNRVAGPAEPARGPRARTDARDGSAVTGIHYGKAPGLSRLTGASFGSGIKGAEQARLAEPGVDPRIKKRVYFYLTNNNADMPKPEAGLGSHVYRAELGNMYDPTRASAQAVARVRGAMQGAGANAFESAVLDAGFRGYVNREQGTAVVLNSDVPVAYEGLAQASQMRDRNIERIAPAMATRQEGGDMVRRPAGDEMMGIVKARPALAKAAPSFRLEFGEARVAAAEVGAANRALADAGAGFRFDAQQEDVNSPFVVMRSTRVSAAPIEEPNQFDAKPGDEITVVRLASMPGLGNTNAASVRGLYTYLSMIDDDEIAAGSEAQESDTVFLYKVKVPEGGFGDYQMLRGGRNVMKDQEIGGAGRMKAKWGGYWYSFPQGTEADLIGSIPLTTVRETAKRTQGSDNFDYIGTAKGATAIGEAFKEAGFEFGEGALMFSNRIKLADDLAEQEKFLQAKAEKAGYKTVDEFVDQDYDGFVEAAAQWRQENPADVMMSNRSKEGWFLGKDELGRIKLGAGAKAYRFAADVASNVLDKVGMRPISTELGRAMRQMKVEIAKAREMTVDAAEQLGKLSTQEREMISDVIEQELKRGVKPPQRVLELAASMQGIMSEQTAELVRLGMLSEDAAGRWDGKYLPRFYESKLMDDGKRWAKAAKALLGRTKTMQGIKGSSLKGRGLFQTVPVAELEQWLAEGWEERDPNFDPDTDTEITVWRDYSRKEREDMGEVRDSMFRFVMGYNKSQRDIALGRLYENLADTVASKSEKEGYVQVPKTNVEDTYARRYGKLAGKWVPQEVLDHLSGFDEAQSNELLGMYRKAMSMWKEGKTVLNPVSHANNVLSNVTMAHFAGVSYWDVSKYLGATRELVKRSPMVAEAEDAGLWTGTMTQAELVNLLPDQLKVLAAKTESKAGKAVDTVWNAMSFWLRKPLGKAYEAEDLFFRYLIYRDARGRGLEPADAVDYAQKYIFTYDDLPKGARRVRDFALPFFAYTYKVVPALAQTALEHPWRLAAPAAILYTVNAAMYAIAAGADEDDWMELIKRYVTDEDFREKAKAMEADERTNLPPWMKGATAIGTPKAIRLGMDEVTGLPLFLDVARVFPGGDLFDAHNNAGGVPLLAPITPNNPILTAAAALLFNKDTFRGTELVKASDTSEEAAAKRAKWAYQQIAPAIAVGNGHFDRAMNVIANVTGEPLDLFFTEYTGVGKDGLPVQPGYAAMQTVGVKVRPYDLDTSAQINRAQQNKLVNEIDAEIRSTRRLEQRGAITADQAESIVDKQIEKRQRLKEGLTVDGDERK